MPPSVQPALFQHIRELMPREPAFAESIAGILNISVDSAYRRIRGETPLVLDEIWALCEHFGLSMDMVLQLKKGDTVFRNIRVDPAHYHYETYLADILRQLERINGYPGCRLFYVAKDLPLFHNFYFEPLAAFRYFFWNKTLMKNPLFGDRAFSFDCVPSTAAQIGRELVAAYGNTPATEIWNTECINSAIMQIEFYKDSGYFSSSSDIAVIYESLADTLSHIKKQVEAGFKFLPGAQKNASPISFFFNRVLLGDNTILVCTDTQQMAYLNYNLLNYLFTSDRLFCDTCYEDIRNLMRKSTLISQTGEKQRNIFFNILHAKVNERIKALSS